MTTSPEAAPFAEVRETPFDITKQVWIFDPNDMTVTVDGMWELCQIHGEDDFPCVEEPNECERLQAEAEACGHAIASLPTMFAALRDAERALAQTIDDYENALISLGVTVDAAMEKNADGRATLVAARAALARATQQGAGDVG